MGAAIALQSAAIEPRIEAVAAEAPFANLREVSYDYAGLDVSPMLGRTLFRPASIVALLRFRKRAVLIRAMCRRKKLWPRVLSQSFSFAGHPTAASLAAIRSGFTNPPRVQKNSGS